MEKVDEVKTGVVVDVSMFSDIVIPEDKLETETKTKTIVRQIIDVSKPLVNVFKINPEANETALMTDELFNDLVELIREQTQLVPILLWFNPKTKEWELVDGRHRTEACNILRIKVKMFKLDKNITEDALPMAILSIQLGNKIIDTTIANCEAVRYIERFETRGLQADLIKKFRAKLNSTAIKHLKNIRRVEPIWFETLRIGKYVEFEKSKLSKSLSVLAGLCLKKEQNLLESESKNKEDGAQDQAIAFQKMEPHIDALLSVAGTSKENLFAIKKLLENNSNISLMSTSVKNKLEEQRILLAKRSDIINSLQKRIDMYENLFSEMQKKKIINTKKLGKLHAFKLLKNI